MSFTTPTIDVYLAGTTLGIGNVNASTINIGQTGTTINVGGLMSFSTIANGSTKITDTLINASNASFTNMSFTTIANGSTIITGTLINASNASFTNMSFSTIANGSTNITSKLINASNASFTNVSCVTGTFTSVYSAGFYSTSDYKLKENIEYIGNEYEIQNLKPCTFNFINSSTKKIGLIAQDVKEIIPESVISSGDSLNIDYGALVSASIFSIQKILKKLEILSNKVEKIEKYLNLE